MESVDLIVIRIAASYLRNFKTQLSPVLLFVVYCITSAAGSGFNSNERRVERDVNTLPCVRRRNLSQIVLISPLVAYVMRYFAVAMN